MSTFRPSQIKQKDILLIMKRSVPSTNISTEITSSQYTDSFVETLVWVKSTNVIIILCYKLTDISVVYETSDRIRALCICNYARICVKKPYMPLFIAIVEDSAKLFIGSFSDELWDTIIDMWEPFMEIDYADPIDL